MELELLIVDLGASILDIVIVAIIIYVLLKVLVKTERHAMILNAMILITLLYALSSALNLATLNYLMSNIYSWGIIIIVVIFQHEIKDGLEKLGSFQNFMSDKSETEKFEQELIDAVYELAKSRTGALITIERNSSLRQYTEKAVQIDAVFSKYLLLTIFNKETSLHDGAVIIKEERISYASTYYPISLDINLSKQTGTRHRAGLTISKDTDSITIIVSEETGHVSVAYKNKMYSNLEPEFLKELLNEKVDGE